MRELYGKVFIQSCVRLKHEAMKRILLLMGIMASVLAADAKERLKNVDLTGSWKETTRMNKGKMPIEYTDTTHYDFLIGNEYTTQRANSFMYRGTYKLTPGRLDLGMRAFMIEEMNNDRMVLRDDGGVYEFRRYDKTAAMMENNSAAGHSQRAMSESFAGDTRVDRASLAGKWESYKRTSSTTMNSVDYERVIRMLDISTKNNTLSGSAYSTKDMDGMPSWKIWKYEDGILYLSGKSNRQLKMVKASDGELIVQEDNLTYFFKEFK
jgi:hypothetical protein